MTEATLDAPALEAQASADPDRDRFAAIRSAIHDRVLSELGGKAEGLNRYAIIRRVEETMDLYLEVVGLILSSQDRDQLLKTLVADVVGYGPLDPLFADDLVSDIIVNGRDKVYVERGGRLERTRVRFDSDSHLMDVIQRMVISAGRRVDENSPMCDARLADGSRINVIIPPLSVRGACLTIRKLRRVPLSVEDLIENGTLTREMVEFLRACVVARMNIVVAGGGTSGKTTLLNVLSGFIPRSERIITIEDTAELKLRQRHVIRLESRPSNVEGHGNVDIRDLVVNSLRMRPDRIVVGEVRSGEALDMLQAMNTGHDGSLTTVHANSARDSISRLETLVLMAGMDLPSRAIREQIASAINLIVQIDRLRDGSRKVTSIAEVMGLEANQVMLDDLFVYRQLGYEAGRAIGGHFPTGVIPRCLATLQAAGVDVPLHYFQPASPELVPD